MSQTWEPDRFAAYLPAGATQLPLNLPQGSSGRPRLLLGPDGEGVMIAGIADAQLAMAAGHQLDLEITRYQCRARMLTEAFIVTPDPRQRARLGAELVTAGIRGVELARLAGLSRAYVSQLLAVGSPTRAGADSTPGLADALLSAFMRELVGLDLARRIRPLLRRSPGWATTILKALRAALDPATGDKAERRQRLRAHLRTELQAHARARDNDPPVAMTRANVQHKARPRPAS